MFSKGLKLGIITTIILLVTGGVLFGSDLVSYLRSGVGTVRESVKEAIPTEFELSRAGDLLDEIIPEMQANIRLIAAEEVEIAALKKDIAAGQERLTHEQAGIEKLSAMLNTTKTSFRIGQRRYSREQLKLDLARRFDRFTEAETVLAGKDRLLASREKSLSAAIAMLDRTRAQKALLEEKIAALQAQHRLVKAASVGSQIRMDGTKLAKADKLIHDLKKRLDVAERVLAHEARFTEPIELDVITEADLLAQIRDHFSPTPAELAAMPGLEADNTTATE